MKSSRSLLCIPLVAAAFYSTFLSTSFASDVTEIDATSEIGIAACLWERVFSDQCDQLISPLNGPVFPGVTGDWLGARPRLAENGVTFQGDITTFNFGVVSGGTNRTFKSGGHGDYVFNFDGGKLGIQEGLFLKVRAEHRFGESISRSTGAIMPATVAADLPVPGSEELYLTNFVLTQAFSESFAVFGGKIDSFDGDMNAYAHGRGKTQFSNMALVANPLLLRTVPYAALAAGFVIMNEGHPVFTFTAMNPTDTISTSGVRQLYKDGVTLTAEARIPTNLFGQTGHQLLGGAWSSKTYTSLGQDPRIIIGLVPIAQQDGSWAVYYNFDQQLIANACDPTKGWGVFGRASIGDSRTNPLGYFLSLGVGGSSTIPGRSEDNFGLGWYYLGASSKLGPLLGNLGDGQGVELFYNYKVNSWINVTPDFQVIVPGRQNIDTAVALGIRASITL